MNRIVVVTGARGMLGSAVVDAACARGLDFAALSRGSCDVTNVTHVRDALSRHDDPIVVNCAGIVRGRKDVKGNRMLNVNARGPHILAKYSGRLVQVSTDCVYDGTTQAGGYTEASPTSPSDYYGYTKLKGEVVEPPHLTVRGSFVGLGNRGLLHWLLAQPEGVTIPGFADWLWNGSYVRAFASRLLDLALGENTTGLLHLPGPTVITKHDLLVMVAKTVRPDLVVTAKQTPRKNMVLASNRIAPMDVSWNIMLEQLDEDYRRYPGRP